MAYDEDLAGRVREQLAAKRGLAEKAMFGGVAFLLDGNMAVGLSGEELMVRVGPERSDAALARPHTRPFDMTGRPMKGWVLVAPEALGGEQEFAEWVSEGVAFARSLPPKEG
jgi:TfoX/Sxy family transcriptional regulator of competence genes